MAIEIQRGDLELDMGPKSCKSKYTPSQCYFNGARGVLTFARFGPISSFKSMCFNFSGHICANLEESLIFLPVLVHIIGFNFRCGGK